MPFRSRYVDCRIQYVIAKINERVCRDCPDLQELARTLNISPSHLRHLFKHEVGVSPNKYIKLMRLEKLRALLMGSKIQIKQAIAVIGLSDFSHTVRDYKALYGQTPLQTNKSANGRVRVSVLVSRTKKMPISA